MAQQIINTGTAPNDGTGDTLKTSFTKTNANFTELYSKPPGNAYTASGTAPSSPNAGDLWYDLSTGITAVYVNDGNSSQWIQIAPALSGPPGQNATGLPAVGFRANKNAVNQTGLVAGVQTKITFTTEDYDAGGTYDAATSRWTPPAGIVHLSLNIGFVSGITASGFGFASIAKNGVMIKTSPSFLASGETCYTQISVDDVANGTDYFEAFASGSSGTVTVDGNITYSFFSGHIVSQQGPKGDTGPSGTVSGYFAPPQGRLTLDSSNPVMVATVTSANTIYYSAYIGDKVPIWDGTIWSMMGVGSFLSCALTDATKNPGPILASQCHDWFVWNDAGTLRLGHGPAWTSDTARSAGTLLARQNGIWLNSVAITNGPAAGRGTYVGTTRSNSLSTLDWLYGTSAAGGGQAFFGVWNAYNRVNVRTIVKTSTLTWSMATAANPRPAENSNAFRVSWICGLVEDAFDAQYAGTLTSGTSGAAAVGVGLDTTTAFTGVFARNNLVTYQTPAFGSDCATVLGFHFYQAMEGASTAGTTAFYGFQAGTMQTGLTFAGRM